MPKLVWSASTVRVLTLQVVNRVVLFESFGNLSIVDSKRLNAQARVVCLNSQSLDIAGDEPRRFV